MTGFVVSLTNKKQTEWNIWIHNLKYNYSITLPDKEANQMLRGIHAFLSSQHVLHGEKIVYVSGV